MLKLGCTLPKFVNICLQKSTGSKIYRFTERRKDLLEKIREDEVGGPLIVIMDIGYLELSTDVSRSCCQALPGIVGIFVLVVLALSLKVP